VPSAFSTSCFVAACSCSVASVSPLLHPTVFRPITYWPPRLEMEPSTILLAVTYAIPQVIRSLGILGSQAGLPEVGIVEAEPNIGHSEIGIEFDGAFQEGDCLSVALDAPRSNTHSVSTCSVEQ